jgi:proteasome lid subunit RPN8/RPN11
MISSIRATLRALLAPEHRLSCSKARWAELLQELRRRGRGQHESGAFLLGLKGDDRREVKAVVYYDDLDPHAYDSGVCVLHGDSFAKLWKICRERNLSVVADVHTHPGVARQSQSDQTNPMVANVGHVAIIVPNFARAPVVEAALGIYEYSGDYEWENFNGPSRRRYFYVGFCG